MNSDEIGRRMYEAAGLDTREPPEGGAEEIARRLFGTQVIYEQPRALADAKICTIAGQRRIVLREGMCPRRANFYAAQAATELFLSAEAWFRELSAPERAPLCRAVAGWLVAPAETFRGRAYQVRAHLGALSEAFAITRTAAALRLSEVMGVELAVVGRRAIHRRGRRFDWLSDEQLRAIAAKRTTRSVRRVSLRDDGKAVALFAA
jgi:hypothetical protein